MKKRRYSKFKNVTVTTADGRFDSKGELRRWNQLKLLHRAGEIQDLRRQVSYDIEVLGLHICRYVADYTYTDGGRKVVEDFKGVRTDTFRLKKKLMKAVHGIDVYESS